jgi:hypothetical protein
MDMRLFSWAFFVSDIFPNIWCHDLDRVEFPALTLLSWPSSRIWAALPGPLILENTILSLAHREVPLS